MFKRRHKMCSLGILALLLVACGTRGGATPLAGIPVAGTPTPVAPPGAQPSPSPTHPQPPPSPSSPRPQTSPAERVSWTYYPSLNYVNDLAFAPDGAVWAAIYGGVVRWDLDNDTPTHMRIPGGSLAHVAHQVAIHTHGTVWVATSGGVARFDGTDWHVYTSNDGLPADVSYAVAVAPDGTVWAGTEAGLAYFDGNTWTIPAAGDAVASSLVWSVAVSPEGVVWASTQGDGVVRYDPRADHWMAYRDEFPFPNARAMAVAPDGTPWVHIGYDHVYYLDGETWRVAYEAGGGQWVCDIAFAKGESPYPTMPFIATCDGYHTYGAGLVYFDSTDWAYTTVEDGLLRNSLTAVAVAEDGTLAVGTDRGISVHTAGRWRALRQGPTLREVTALAITPNDAVWMGFGTSTWHPPGGGVTRFSSSDETWQYFSGAAMPFGGNVRVLTVSPGGELWAGTGCNLLRFQDGAWETVVTCDDGLLGNVRFIQAAPDGSLWMVTDYNVYHLVDSALNAYGGRLPSALAVTPDNVLWLGYMTFEAGGGLVAFDGTDWITQTALPLNSVNALAVAEDGTLWAAGNGGVARLAEGTWRSYTQGLPHDRGVKQLALAPNGRVWAITLQTLLYLEGDGWQEVPLPFEVALHTFAFTSEGAIWLGTDRGALYFEP